MAAAIRVFAATIAIAGCSNGDSHGGNVVVAVTVDWEGAYFAADGLEAMEALRLAEPRVPLTHFVSAGYFTKPTPDPDAAGTMRKMMRPGDQVAVHVHGWGSLARAAGVEPKVSPSFLTGTDKLVELEDGDAGFDTDLDVYTAGELRAIVRTTSKLLTDAGLQPSRAFRAGGFLATPRVLQAIRDEGLTVDSSAIDAHQVTEEAGEVLGARVAEIWPKVDTTSQPWNVELHGGSLLELPIAAYADYMTGDAMIALLDGARARLARDPEHDVFLVIGFHQETAGEFAGRIDQMLAAARRYPESVTFATVDEAAARARVGLRAKPH